MSYKFSTGSLRQGDIYYEDDRLGASTYIDFGQDSIALRPSGTSGVYAISASVGIGTDDPQAALHVSAHDSVIRLDDLSSNYRIDLEVAGGLKLMMGTTTNSDAFMTLQAHAGLNKLDTVTRDFHLYGNNTATGFYFDESAGLFGVGTSSPAARLHVSGTHGSLFQVDSVSGSVGTILYVSGGAAGRVGIGTTSPAKELTVVGDVSASGDLYGSNLYIAASGQNVIQVGNTGATLSKWEWLRDGTRKWVIYNDGRASPSLVEDGLHFKSGISSDADATNLAMVLKPDQGAKFYGDVNVSGTHGSLFQVDSKSGSVGTILYVSGGAAGRVGIGTDVPSANLSISGRDNANLLEVRSDSNVDIISVSGSGKVGFGTTAPAVAWKDFDFSGPVAITDGNLFFDNDKGLRWGDSSVLLEGDGATEQLIIKANSTTYFFLDGDASPGKIGLGTTSPGSNLQTSGSVGFNVTSFAAAALLDGTHHVAVADCNGGSVTLTLPVATTAMAGRQYIIKRADSGGSGGGNSLTIGRNGKTIDGAGSDLGSIENGTSHTLICVGSSGWIIVDKYVGI